MDKREKVIKGLECCVAGAECDHCPYSMMNQTRYEGCYQMLIDALALLKVLEPMNANVVLNGIDRSGGWWYQCPNCKMEIEPREKYCKNCGQAVKWE